MNGGYESLLELAERERELIEAGLWDDVVTLGAARAQLVAELPPQAPSSARALLEQAASIVESNVAAIATASDAVRRELNHLQRGRTAIASYGANRSGHRIDTRG